jgi:hypothetical protein
MAFDEARCLVSSHATQSFNLLTNGLLDTWHIQDKSIAEQFQVKTYCM